MILSEKSENRVRMVPLQKSAPNPSQPRREFRQEELEQLAQSIAANGLLQPVVLRRTGQGYEIIAGERRCRACALLGYTEVPALIRSVTEKESAVLALIENLQRQDLGIFDEAEGIYQLVHFWGITQEEAAQRLGIAQSTLANKLRLLKLCPAVREIIMRYGLTERHARALLKLTGPEQQQKVLEKVLEKSWNVAQTEQYIGALLQKRQGRAVRLFVLKDVRLFLNTMTNAVATMKNAGVDVVSYENDGDDYIEYIVRIPKACGIKAKSLA
ncbi:MAG: ParB/RepB/Spo0J family partition protein [Oscillospiraceae bacterium]|nr:ParB/RepB/Spo0J family partition protein [Oscillospiraceae bacterium]